MRQAKTFCVKVGEGCQKITVTQCVKRFLPLAWLTFRVIVTFWHLCSPTFRQKVLASIVDTSSYCGHLTFLTYISLLKNPLILMIKGQVCRFIYLFILCFVCAYLDCYDAAITQKLS